jgi:hypothetical protein
MDLPPEIQARVKALASEFNTYVLETQMRAPTTTINEAFIGFVTEKIARLEVISQGLLDLYNANNPESEESSSS